MSELTRRQFIVAGAAAAFLGALPWRLQSADAAGVVQVIAGWGSFIDAAPFRDGVVTVARRGSEAVARVFDAGFQVLEQLSVPTAFSPLAVGSSGDAVWLGGWVSRTIGEREVEVGGYLSYQDPDDRDEPGVERFMTASSTIIQSYGGVFPAVARWIPGQPFELVDVSMPPGEGGRIGAILDVEGSSVAFYHRYPDAGISEGYGVGAIGLSVDQGLVAVPTDITLNHGAILFSAQPQRNERYLVVSDLGGTRLVPVGNSAAAIGAPDSPPDRVVVGVSKTDGVLAVDVLSMDTESAERWKRSGGDWERIGDITEVRRSIAPGIDVVLQIAGGQ
jgi:hypothetical protein